jgi:hypothetical protein
MHPERLLLERYLDHLASPEEVAALGRLLVERTDLADALAKATRTEAQLERHFRTRQMVARVDADLAARPGEVLRLPQTGPRRRPWRWVAAALVLLTLGALGGYWLGSAGARPSAVVSGRVLVDGVEADLIPDGARLAVAGAGDAVIRLPDGSEAELAPESEVVLHARDDGWRPRWSGGGRKVVELDRGRGTFHAEKSRQKLRVDTPLGSVSARRAAFSVKLQPVDEEGEGIVSNRIAMLLVVAALFGEVEVRSEGTRFLLGPGQSQVFAGPAKPAVKPPAKKPSFAGTVVAVTADGNGFTLELPPAKKGEAPTRRSFRLGEGTKFHYFGVAKEGQKPTVGYLARVWLEENSADAVARVQLGLKQKVLTGKIVKLSEDGKTLTLESPAKQGKSYRTDFRLIPQTKFVPREVKNGRPAVGQFAQVWFQPGSTDTASGVVFADNPKDLGGKPKPGKPAANKKPAVAGVVKAVSEDGKTLTLESPPAVKGGAPGTATIRLTEKTKVRGAKGKPAVGLYATAWLAEGSKDTAAVIALRDGKAQGRPAAKPSLGGVVKAVSEDGKTLTLETPPAVKGGTPGTATIRLTEKTKVRGAKGKPAVGLHAAVWLADGSKDTATVIALHDGKARGKPEGGKPSLGGVIKAVSEDGKTLTLETPPAVKGGAPGTTTIRLTETTKVRGAKSKPAVGLHAAVWLADGSKDTARVVALGPNKPAVKKPVNKKNQIDLAGTIKAVSEDGKTLTVARPAAVKGAPPNLVTIRLTPTTVVPGGKAKPAVGQYIAVRLAEGSKDTAAELIFPDMPVKKPKPKPALEEKITLPPEVPIKPRPPRDPGPVAAFIDAEVGRRLAAEKVPASPPADDAEFLRRVTLDLTGRVPTLQRAAAFLDSRDPHKRRKLVDELLASPAYGGHFATIWRNLIEAREEGTKKYRQNLLVPWLTREFNRNRGWNELAAEMLTATGPLKDTPQSAFLLANAEGFKLQPNLIAASATKLFLGVRLGCAECHDHPFASWKQSDFWATAAFFSRVRYSGYKNVPVPFLTEEIPEGKTGNKIREEGLKGVFGAAIEIPPAAGRRAGRIVKARFLGGAEPDFDNEGPFRPRFAAWLTAGENPYFARATVNRLWGHLFGHGVVDPVDNFDDNNPPSHPALLKRLADEYVASAFDQKHLLRCIVLSKTYQRTSRPLPGNRDDHRAFSHMALKVMTPEVLFDSLGVVTALDPNDKEMLAAIPAKRQAAFAKGKGKVPYPREVFARLFRPTGDETKPTEYSQGIPHLLNLMNSPLLNGGAPLVEKIVHQEMSPEAGVTTLYLAALARRPTPAEVRLMAGYLERRGDPRAGYQGVLWALLNSSEFVINH